MKYNQSFKLGIISLLCLSIACFLFISTAQADINEEVGRLKLKYETLYKRYTQNLSNGISSDQNALARQVGIAKREYEKALKQITPSSSTKSHFKKNIAKVADVLKNTFNHGAINRTDYVASGTGTILPGFATSTVEIDGNNYCGQFAMTIALKGMGIPTTAQEVYKDTNPAGIFTSAPTMVEYLNMHGLKASIKQKASIADLVKRLDDGKPVITLVDCGGVQHWICIVGYKEDSSGNITGVITRDSVWGKRKPQTIDIEKFKKIWGNPTSKILGNFENYSNFMISINGKRKAAFSPPLFSFNFWTAPEDNFGSGVNDTVSGFKNLSPTQFAGGLTKLGLGIPGSVLSASSNLLAKGSDKATNWGKNKWSQGGTLNKIIGGGAVVAGYAAKATAMVGRGAASISSSIASIAGNAIKKLGFVFAR